MIPIKRILAALTLLPMLALAQSVKLTDEVPYVQTPQAVVDKMLELSQVRATDFIIDLGSGDGRIVITAAKRSGARGFGVDIAAPLVAEATRRAQSEGVADRAAFYQRDLFETDLRQATVVTMYLLPEYNLLLRPRLLAQLRPGARVVSHDWDMGDWTPDYKAEVPVPDKSVGLRKSSKVYVWIVPARVEGRWNFAIREGTNLQPAEARIGQRYQEIGGTLRIGAVVLPIEHGAIRGADISFRVEHASGTIRFQGRVAQDRIEGTMAVAGARSQPWQAQRQSSGS
jgi:hypothetical protein